jgi:hypothetical protein
VKRRAVNRSTKVRTSDVVNREHGNEYQVSYMAKSFLKLSGNWPKENDYLWSMEEVKFIIRHRTGKVM